MARISGIDIPKDKRGAIALTYIYGIGRSLAITILEEAKVAAVPGSAFGLEPYFRVSYATSTEDLKIAIQNIKKSVSELI